MLGLALVTRKSETFSPCADFTPGDQSPAAARRWLWPWQELETQPIGAALVRKSPIRQPGGAWFRGWRYDFFRASSMMVEPARQAASISVSGSAANTMRK